MRRIFHVLPRQLALHVLFGSSGAPHNSGRDMTAGHADHTRIKGQRRLSLAVSAIFIQSRPVHYVIFLYQGRGSVQGGDRSDGTAQLPR